MGASDLNRLIISFPHSDAGSRKLSNTEDHHHKPPSSSSQTPTAIDINSQEGETVNLVSSSVGELKVGDCEDEYPKTPRTVEHRIPVTIACPPAPRKAKRVPITGKRRTSSSCFPVVRVPDEFMVYMDAMLALNETVYVPDIVVGDLAAGDHVKRLKLLPQAHEA